MLRRLMLLTAAAALVGGLPLGAQGKGPKKYRVSNDRATVVVREVLGKHGFVVIKVEDKGPDRIVYYRAGNQGRGRGLGPPRRLVIRRVEREIVFLDVPDAILVDIDVRLRL
ncbi:MAG TPA: hypothetical protein VNI61_09995 [Gemmatimonadales bacterium]|nr:hypothetical protein [Gemmatimonadales bacterium]